MVSSPAGASADIPSRADESQLGAFEILDGRVLAPGSEGGGWWDSRCAAMPIVLPPSENHTYWRCFYYGRPSNKWNDDLPAFLPSGISGLATSEDGLNWSRVRGPLKDGAILRPSDDATAFDHVHVGMTDVVPLPDGSYAAFYFGGSSEKVNLGMGPGEIVGLKMRPGAATSRDGLSWERRNGGQPLLEVGSAGAWDNNFVSWPRVLPLDPKQPHGDWLMTYHALMPPGTGGIEAPRWAVGAAISKSGNPLGPYQKASVDRPVLQGGEAGSWDERGIGTRHVVHSPDGNGLVMVYEGVGGDGRHRLGLATSADGLSWTKAQGIGPEPGGPIFEGAPPDLDAWDNGQVGTPWLVALPQGGWRLYYVGTSPKGQSSLAIGAAESETLFSRDWRRVGSTC